METINSEVKDYINKYYGNSSDDLEEFRLTCEKDHVPIISRETQGFLSLLLNIVKPSRILEIGTGVGYSATFFAKTLPECKITTLELIDKRYIEAHINIEKFRLSDRIKIIEGDASQTLIDLHEDNEEFDFVFIDSAKSRYRDFFDKSVMMINGSGYIVSDNVMLDGRTASDSFMTKHRDKTSMLKMRDYIEYLRTNDKYETQLFNIGDGITVSRINQD